MDHGKKKMKRDGMAKGGEKRAMYKHGGKHRAMYKEGGMYKNGEMPKAKPN
jgi:hypothetical protein